VFPEQITRASFEKLAGAGQKDLGRRVDKIEDLYD
jgi:hypothetical protein